MRNEPARDSMRPSVWAKVKSRGVRLVVGQLRLGAKPHELALAVALGVALGVFPILGSTTLLCGIAAYRLRLNQPVIQAVNYVVYPVQLIALIPFYRAGEWLLRRPHVPLSVSLLIDRFRADTLKFFADFGVIAIAGICVWVLVAPIIAGTVYLAVSPMMRAVAARTSRAVVAGS